VLSDRERKTLLELERGLAAEDPEFARSFEAPAHGGVGAHPPRGGHSWGYPVTIVVAVLLGVLMFLAGSPVSALACAAVAGAAWLMRRLGGGDGAIRRGT
jgi:hypothetical protein